MGDNYYNTDTNYSNDNTTYDYDNSTPNQEVVHSSNVVIDEGPIYNTNYSTDNYYSGGGIGCETTYDFSPAPIYNVGLQSISIGGVQPCYDTDFHTVVVGGIEPCIVEEVYPVVATNASFSKWDCIVICIILVVFLIIFIVMGKFCESSTKALANGYPFFKSQLFFFQFYSSSIYKCVT